MSSSRRQFINSSVKTTAAIVAAGIPGTGILAKSGYRISTSSLTGYEQTPLPYNYSDLEAVIDAQTMEIHYSRHAAAYAANLRDAAKAEGVDQSKPLESVLANISRYSMKLRNNGGGHYNHEFFWRCMIQGGAVLAEGPLKTKLIQQFGSIESFQTQFSDSAKSRFGSGWAWLYADKDRQLRIGSTPNQDNPLMDVSDIKGTPLLGLDVWEHAYYLRYQNKRADYIAGWWKIVNWKMVEERLKSL